MSQARAVFSGGGGESSWLVGDRRYARTWCYLSDGTRWTIYYAWQRP